MKIGQWTIGRDSKTNEDSSVVNVKAEAPRKKGGVDSLGGLLEFTTNRLSGEKSISPKILQAYKGWIYKNNDVIAKEVAKMEFQLFTVGLKAGEIVFNPVLEHPLLDLLDKMNSTTTCSDGLYITQSHKKLTGDAFWLLQRNGKTVTDIFQLQPDKIELDIGEPTEGSRELIKGYKYTDVIDGNKVTEYYQPEDIIHFKTPNPQNMFRGYGAVEAAMSIIDLDNLSIDTQTKFFKNGAISNFVLTSPNKLQEDQIKRLERQMKAAYGGSRNAFKTMIFGSGLEPKDISFSNKDMQMLDQLEWYRDFLMVIFGNTKASLGIIDDVNRASHESSIIEWKRNSVKPEKDSLVNTLNEFLVPMFGDRLVLGYISDIPEDRTDDIQEATQLYGSGIITLNEARGMLELEEAADGDNLKPSTAPQAPASNEEPQKVYRKLKTNKNLPAALRHLDVDSMLRHRKMFTVKKNHEALKEAAKPLIKQLLKGKKKVHKQEPRLHAQYTNEQVMGYYGKQISIVDALEKQFEEAVIKFIGKIEKQVLEALPSEISKDFKTKALFDEEQLLIQAQIDLTPILIKEAIVAGQEAYKLIGRDDPYIPFALDKRIRTNVNKFTQSMLDTDQERLSKLIADGIREGLSVPQITDSITDIFSTIKTTQSQVITRTEVLRVSNMAAEDAFIQSGVVEAKQWLTAGATDECAQYEGQIAKLGGNFYDSDSEFQDGDPPLHPNCRCVLLPIVVGAKAYQPATIVEREIMQKKIDELESQVDKRTKSFKKLKSEFREKSSDDAAYIKSLEKLIGVDDDTAGEARQTES